MLSACAPHPCTGSMSEGEAATGMAPNEQKNYLGFDFSTQQVKAIVVNDALEVLQEAAVQFDNDLPEYRTHGGVHVRGDQDCTVTAPTIMWVKALDMLMDKLRVAGADFSTIAAISGTAQVKICIKLCGCQIQYVLLPWQQIKLWHKSCCSCVYNRWMI